MTENSQKNKSYERIIIKTIDTILDALTTTLVIGVIFLATSTLLIAINNIINA